MSDASEKPRPAPASQRSIFGNAEALAKTDNQRFAAIEAGYRLLKFTSACPSLCDGIAARYEERQR